MAFISLRDNLDLTTPSGRLMFQIIGAMAEFDIERRSLSGFLISGGHGNGHRDGVVQANTWMDLIEGKEAAQKKSGCDEQDNCLPPRRFSLKLTTSGVG